MKVRIGATRIVFVGHTRAYKVARIRPLKFTCKLFLFAVFPTVRQHLRTKYGPRLGRAFWKYLVAGFYANAAEYLHWHEQADERCIPVLGKVLGMCCIVQPAATPASLIDIVNSPLRTLLADPELSGSAQYGWFKNRLYLLDYAHWRMAM